MHAPSGLKIHGRLIRFPLCNDSPFPASDPSSTTCLGNVKSFGTKFALFASVQHLGPPPARLSLTYGKETSWNFGSIQVNFGSLSDISFLCSFLLELLLI